MGEALLRLALRAAALAALAATAACHFAEDVPPERQPRFEANAGPAPGVALVLGTGGPRGFAHIGVLKVLEEAGIKPDLVVGASVGAMVGALYAGGHSAQDLERLAHEINVFEFFEAGMFDNHATGKAVQNYINTRVKRRPIEKLDRPFAATATRMSDRKLVIFNRGDTGLAVRAASASPEHFIPVEIGGERYIDGDETSPVPIRAARRLGARVVIAVDVSAYEKDTPAGVPRAWIDKDARRAKQVALEAPEADVLLHPNIGYYAGMSADYRRRVIGLAEKDTRENLPAIRAALARAGIATAQAQSSATGRMPSGDASR